MNVNTKTPHRHLLFEDRLHIEQDLFMGRSFKEIGAHIGKDPTTVSKEVRRFIEWDYGSYAKVQGHDCQRYNNCNLTDMCPIECGELCKNCNSGKCQWSCPNFIPSECPMLKRAPFCCNGCQVSEGCELTKYFYRADRAQQRYQSLLVEARRGINTDPARFESMNQLISPLVRKGQPLSHIFSTHKDEIPCSRSTVYNYLDDGLFDVRNIDLPRRVRYKVRKKRRVENPIKYDYRSNRTYVDFQKYIEEFPDYEVVEMDTVKGTNEAGKCLLTLLFRRSNFMLIFVLPSCSQDSVQKVFDYLYEQLGSRIFKKTFRVILTDNGPEFKDPWALEKDSNGNFRTKVFYCDPYTSNQKGKIEKNHEFIRYILPKGKSMSTLDQEAAKKMMCHINSVARDSLNGKSPFDLAELLINKKVLTLLGLRKVSPDDIILKPALLSK